MNSRTLGDVSNTRMLTMLQGATYCGMGRATFRKWAEKIGAIRRFGPTMLRADKKVIDAALDAMPESIEDPTAI